MLRLRQNPSRQGRQSRFYGSHLGAAWLVLFMIFNVVWTLLLYRGAQIVRGDFPYPTQWAFASNWVADLLDPDDHELERSSRRDGRAALAGRGRDRPSW